MSQPTGDAPEEQVYMTEHHFEDVVSRACDFLHAHSVYTDRDPASLPSEVTDYFLHLSEHMLRYIGILPAELGFVTPHMNNPLLLVCDDEYMPYIDVQAEFKRLGIPEGMDYRDAVKLAIEIQQRLDEG